MARLLRHSDVWEIDGIEPAVLGRYRLNDAAIRLLRSHGVVRDGDAIVGDILDKVVTLAGVPSAKPDDPSRLERLGAIRLDLLKQYRRPRQAAFKPPPRPASATSRVPHVQPDPTDRLRTEPLEYLLVRQGYRWAIERFDGTNLVSTVNRKVYPIRKPTTWIRNANTLSVPVGRSEGLPVDGCLFHQDEHWGQRVATESLIEPGRTYLALSPGLFDTDGDSISVRRRATVIPRQVKRRWLGSCGSWSLYEVRMPRYPDAHVGRWLERCGYQRRSERG